MLPQFSGRDNVYVKEATICHDAQNCNAESKFGDNIKNDITNTQQFNVLSLCFYIGHFQIILETDGNFFVEKFTDFPQLTWKIVRTIGPPNVYEFHFLCSVYSPIHS